MAPMIAMHPDGPIPGIAPILPQTAPRGEACELPIHIGVFFAGTGNNQDWAEIDDSGAVLSTQTMRRKDSNVARLSRAYKLKKDFEPSAVSLTGDSPWNF